MKEDYGYTQSNIIDFIHPTEMDFYLNHKSLAPLGKVPVCIAAAVYRISAGNCMPYTGNTNSDKKPSTFNTYQRNESPWDSFKRKKKNEDSSSCSTLESTCSSRSESPEPKHRHHSKKKPSYHMLRREIRRLRGENAFLRSSVSVLKNDLRDSTISRQNADIIHQRTFQEYDLRHKSLEQEILSKRDQVEYLKEQVERLQLNSLSNNNNNHSLTLHDSNYLKRKDSNPFGCFEFEQEDEIMSCQPIAQDSALPEINIKMDELKTDQEIGNEYFKRRLLDNNEIEEEDDDEDEDEKIDSELESFEKAASSYIRQAIIAKLSCARVRLDFDDLIVKHEPSNDTIMSVLADAFIYWLNSIWLKPDTKSYSPHKLFTTLIQPGIDDFWKSILQCYTIDYDCQVSLLNYIEYQVKQLNSSLINHFNRLLVYLYKYEVVEEDAILSWYANTMNNNDSSKHIRIISKHFIDYLECSTEDDDDEDDEEEEEDDDDDNVEDNQLSEDEYLDEDDNISFEFMDSPIPEDDEDINFVFDHEDDEHNSSLHDSIEDFLTYKERNPCICQFNYDNDTTDSPLSSHPPSPISGKHELPECSCDSTYSTPPVTEKKKKSVRIAM